MKTSIKKELAKHILDSISDGILTNENREDWHFYCFNEDSYIIGYYNASQWLKKHDIKRPEAIFICKQYEIDNFGESKIYDNSESVVNMLAYIYGDELIYSENFKSINELKKAMKQILNN